MLKITEQGILTGKSNACSPRLTFFLSLVLLNCQCFSRSMPERGIDFSNALLANSTLWRSVYFTHFAIDHYIETDISGY